MESPVQFIEENVYKSRTILGEPQVPKIISYIKGLGITKTEKQAQVFVLLIVAICMLTSVFLAIRYIVPKKSEIIILKGVMIGDGLSVPEKTQ